MIVHKDVAESLESALKEILSFYGEKKIKELRIDKNYGGLHMVRMKRGGSTYSLHSWAIAIDLNDKENSLNMGSDKALFAKPEYKKLLDIMEKYGWYNLGRYKNYDYMHFQAVKP